MKSFSRVLPDIANSMTDVLLRFRQESVAFSADIEGMFLQVKVPTYQRDFLWFLWWPGGNTALEPKEHRMTVHVFGATSSPSCANFALRLTAVDYGATYDAGVARAVLDNFYVDDCLVTSSTEQDATDLAYNLKELCSQGGFNLTKYMSNSSVVMKSIPEKDRSPKVQNLNLVLDSSGIGIFPKQVAQEISRMTTRNILLARSVIFLD